MNALRTFALVATLAATYPATAVATPSVDPAERMIATINGARADHGLRPLREAPKLDATASRYAKTVIRTDSFSHGSSFRNAGFRTAGEIMASASGWSNRPRSTLRLWLRSPAHRSLILSPSFRYAGAGIARGRLGGPPATVWIVHFGAH